MSVRLTCPGCGCRGDIEAFLTEEDGKRFAAMFAEMEPAVGKAIVRYLRMFKPPSSELRLSRAVALVADLVVLIEAGSVCKDERTNQRRAASPAVWAEAIEQLLSAPPSDLPLRNHHYLRAIAFGIAGEHTQRAPAHAATAAVRPTGISPIREIDRREEQRMWLADQLRYGQITQAEYEKKVAALEDK